MNLSQEVSLKEGLALIWKTKMLVVHTDTVPRSDRNKMLCVPIMRWSDEQGSYQFKILPTFQCINKDDNDNFIFFSFKFPLELM